jgi:hypothetical protein
VAFGLAVLVLVAVAVTAAVSLPWIVAAICLSVLVLDRTRAGRTPIPSDLDLFLERCRRRGEETTFVVVDIPSTAKALPNLLQSFRMTDSLVVRRSGSGCEVHGLLDGRDTVRAAVENRVADALGGITPTFGWASYPADGLTVDALYGKARGAIAAATAQSERAPAVWWRPTTRDSAIEHTLEASPKGA